MYRVELKASLSLWNLISSSQWSVPNVPCGVESSYWVAVAFQPLLFLMYRVELKGILSDKLSQAIEKGVPNVPCGVESPKDGLTVVDLTIRVPNVPCGVERPLAVWMVNQLRLPVPNVPCGVESLKVEIGNSFSMLKVPNVPCGVERRIKR